MRGDDLAEDKIQWHPAFANAFELELKEYYPNAIEIIEEYQLTTKPLEVDIIVIKKKKEVKILKNLAKIFKEHNIIEYKSPSDYISIDDYYKVKAYAYLYKSLGSTVNKIKLEEMTITFVSNNYPKKVIRYLEERHKIKVRRESEGVYYLDGADIETQIIVIDELPKKENRYIRLLTKKLNIKDEISEIVKDFSNNLKDNKIEMLVDLVFKTNLEQFMEVFGMTRELSEKEWQAIDNVMKKFKLNEKYREQGKIEGKTEGKIEGEIKGEKKLLLRLLNKKFKRLPYELIKKIEALDNLELIEKITDNIFDINSIEEVEKMV